jgi:hypothetical protein
MEYMSLACHVHLSWMLPLPLSALLKDIELEKYISEALSSGFSFEVFPLDSVHFSRSVLRVSSSIT